MQLLLMTHPKINARFIMNKYQTIINICAGSALAIMGWFARTLWDAVQELKQDLSKLWEELAKDYVPKDGGGLKSLSAGQWCDV